MNRYEQIRSILLDKCGKVILEFITKYNMYIDMFIDDNAERIDIILNKMVVNDGATIPNDKNEFEYVVVGLFLELVSHYTEQLESKTVEG